MKKIILEIDQNIIEPFNDSFTQVKSDILVGLKNTNKEYLKLLDEKEKILDKYPNLRSVYEDQEAGQLTEEETRELIKIIDLYFDKNAIEDQAIYLKGIESGYLIFKKMGLIKD